MTTLRTELPEIPDNFRARAADAAQSIPGLGRFAAWLDKPRRQAYDAWADAWAAADAEATRNGACLLTLKH